MDVKVTKKDKSIIEIDVTLPADIFAAFEEKALKALASKVKIDGFRDGKAPLDAVKSHVGAAALMDEMAHLAVIDVYPKIIEEKKIDAIGRPSIMIKKMAMGSEFECMITTTVMPEVSFGDYKKIAAKKMEEKLDTEVTQAEIDNAVKELLRFTAHRKATETNPEAKISDIKDEDLGELTDELIKGFGAFESKEDFMKKLQENMETEKQDRAKEKRRIELMEAIAESVKIEVPELLVDYELSKMLSQLEHDLMHSGMTLDGYLTQSGKTRDDIKKEWYAEGEKRAKLQIVLNHIAQTEKISPNEEDVAHEVAHLLDHYKGQQVDEENIRAYVTSFMTNQKVIQFLEEQK